VARTTLRWRPPGSPAAFVAYCVVSLLCFGVPLLAHPGRSYVGAGTDPEIFIWSFAWWPHALLHGQNPIATHAIWAPDGFNLAWATTTPGLALAFAPVTLLAGPVVAYNLAALLMPALAAWTAFLLCRYLTRSFWPSLLGGYLFGFSSYMLGQEEGHLHMTSVFLVPLVALFILRYLDGRETARGLALELGLVLAAQLSFSTELFFSLTLALAVALLTGYWADATRRERLRSLVGPLAVAYLLAAVLTSPLLVYALIGFRSGSVNPPGGYVADLLNFVVPTGLTLASGHRVTEFATRFPGNSSEQDAYLGVPIIVIAGWYFLHRWRTAARRFFVVVLVVGVVAALGPALYVGGRRIAAAPWALVDGLPLFNNLITSRFALYLALITAVIVSLWVSGNGSRRRLRVVLPVLAVIALLPQLQFGLWRVTPHVPAFFTAAAYRDCLQPGENVLIVLPQAESADALLWQARAGFRFRMAGGQISPEMPRSFTRYAAVRALRIGFAPPRRAADVLAFARAKRAGTILIDGRYAQAYQWLRDGLGKVNEVGGMLVYRVERAAGTAASCPA
jgi:hypothetical protein